MHNVQNFNLCFCHYFLKDSNLIIHLLHFIADPSVFNGEDFTLLRHSRPNQPHPNQPREYLTMHVDPVLQQHQRGRSSSIEANTNPASKEMTPPPPPPPEGVAPSVGGLRCHRIGGLGQTGAVNRHPLVDFCTLRRPPNNRPRAVQFADQQNPVRVFDKLLRWS